MAEKKTIADILKANLIESTVLFFTPVTAVLREFIRAVGDKSGTTR
jgi:hypothetical protein